MEFQLGALPVSPDILGKTNVGLWAFELDEGKEPRMYVDDVMLGLLGLKEQIPPEQTYHAWYDRVDSEYLGIVNQMVRKVTNGERAEVQYPWHHPDGYTMYVRCGGVRNYAYTKGVRIEGQHQDVTGIIHYNKEQVEKQKDREYQMIIESVTEDYNLVEHIDIDTGKVDTYKKTGLFEEFIDKYNIKNFFDMIPLFAKEYLAAEDIEEFVAAQTRPKIASELNRNIVYLVRCKLMRNGKVEWYQMRYQRHETHEDFNCAILAIQNITVEHEEKEIAKEHGIAQISLDNAIKNCFEDSYSDSDIDPIKGLLQSLGEYYGADRAYIYEFSGDRKAASITYEWCSADTDPSMDKCQNISIDTFSLLTDRFENEGYVYITNDGAKLKDKSSPAYKMLKKRGIESLIASPVVYQKELVGFVALDNPSRFLFDSNAIHSSAIVIYGELLKKHAKDVDTITLNKLSDSYDSVHYIDFRTDFMRIYSVRNKYLESIHTNEKYSESMGKYIGIYVDELDRERLTEMTDSAYVMDHFKKNGTLEIHFVAIGENNSRRHYILKYIKANEDGTCAVLCGSDNTEYLDAEYKQNTVINGLSKEYHTVIVIDDKQHFTTFRANSDYIDNKVEAILKLDEYTPAIRQYVEKVVFDEDKFKVKEKTSWNALKENVTDNNIYSVTYRVVSENGNIQYNQMSFAKSIDDEGRLNYVLGFRDVDAMIKEEQKREKDYERLQAISQYLAGSFSSVYYCGFKDNTMALVYSSHGLEKLHSFSGQSIELSKRPYTKMIDRFTSDLVDEEEKNYVTTLLQEDNVRKKLKEVPSFTFIIHDATLGIERTYRAHVTHGADDDHIVIGFVDVTDELIEEEERKRTLEEALHMAEAASRAKTTFLNNMSHDIRTPMNAIIGFTELAETHIDDKEKVKDYLSKIGQSSDHLLSLINDVLDMSRIESGKMTIEEKEENLSEIVHALKSIVENDVREKNLDLRIDTQDVTNESIMCDKMRLNQVLLNVLSNAVKYTPAGGKVVMTVKETPSPKKGFGMFEFRVKDNGIGMSEEFLSKIFDPFTRMKSSTVSGIQGTGLGMSITKNILDLMKGTISVKSTENEGTEVTINIEFKLCESADISGLDIMKGKRALIVDEDIGSSQHISGILKEIGMRTEWCLSGTEAASRTAEAVKNGDNYRVIIVDSEISGGDSVSTVKNIMAKAGKEKPAIILTSFDLNNVSEEAKEAGVTGFISKPVFKSDIYGILGSLDSMEMPFSPFSAVANVFAGRKVLLVEDNELNREIAEEILKEAGFVITPAEDGSVAVEIMKKAKRSDFDIVLMDIQMPVMNGFEATKAIRAIPEWNDIPIIAMTANAFEEDRKAAIEAGMNEHIAKPINIGMLKATLAKHLNK